MLTLDALEDRLEFEDDLLSEDDWLNDEYDEEIDDLESLLDVDTENVAHEFFFNFFKKACPNRYQRGEVRKSKTSKGHLPRDVSEHANGQILIADFGVNWGSLKSSTKKDPLLKTWLKIFNNDPSYRLKIVGYSDCIGKEKNNKYLRKRRAKKVYKFLREQGISPSQIISVVAAPSGNYIIGTNNSTIQGRAKNRGVVIKFHREFDFFPDQEEPITVSVPPSLKQIVDRALRLLPRAKSLSSEQKKRIKCFLKKLLDPKIDDSYVSIAKWESGDVYLWKKRSIKFFKNHYLSYLRKTIRGFSRGSDRRFVFGLMHLDEQIFLGIYKARRLELPVGGGSSVSPGNRQIHDWIARQQRNKKSIYYCYR